MMQSSDDLLSQLRPVTGPLMVAPPDEANWWAVVGGIAAGILITALIFRILFRKRKPTSARDEALAALNQLSSDPTATSMAVLDQICRNWLGRVYRVDADHETGRSIVDRLPQSVREEWSAIFAQLEPGRFSREPLTTNQWNELTNGVRHRISSATINISDSGGL